MRRRLRELVECESPTDDAAGVNRAAALVAEWAAAIGGRAKWHRQRGYGDVLELRFGMAGGGRARRRGHCCCWDIWIRFGPWARCERCRGARRRMRRACRECTGRACSI